ncbi:uncharacterized protein LOC119586924 [Penaeus monodon]|uniref:uncharacterized protein LOC119586924 n=1 Tax=Penaeus monodon TaxID=6687 RepID=UPI0018A78817|nr:uncharacterized protein LOC119586924 [Penaeus monodon]
MSQVCVFGGDDVAVADLWSARTHGRFLDVTLVCRGGALLCHRVVLAAASPLLAAELRGAHSVISLVDVPLQQVYLVLQVMYRQSFSFPHADLPGFLAALRRCGVDPPRYTINRVVIPRVEGSILRALLSRPLVSSSPQLNESPTKRLQEDVVTSSSDPLLCCNRWWSCSDNLTEHRLSPEHLDTYEDNCFVSSTAD